MVRILAKLDRDRWVFHILRALDRNLHRRNLSLNSVDEDFDQALAKYGTPNGPYLVLPIFGPTSTRHAFGRTVDGLLNPTTYFLPFLGNAGLTVGEQVNSFSFYVEDKKALDQDAIDPYQSMQNFYYQNRQKKIKE